MRLLISLLLRLCLSILLLQKSISHDTQNRSKIYTNELDIQQQLMTDETHLYTPQSK